MAGIIVLFSATEDISSSLFPRESQLMIFMPLSGICSTEEIGWDNGVIDFYPLHFMFPQGIARW